MENDLDARADNKLVWQMSHGSTTTKGVTTSTTSNEAQPASGKPLGISEQKSYLPQFLWATERTTRSDLGTNATILGSVANLKSADVESLDPIVGSHIPVIPRVQLGSSLGGDASFPISCLDRRSTGAGSIASSSSFEPRQHGQSLVFATPAPAYIPYKQGWTSGSNSWPMSGARDVNYDQATIIDALLHLTPRVPKTTRPPLVSLGNTNSSSHLRVEAPEVLSQQRVFPSEEKVELTGSIPSATIDSSPLRRRNDEPMANRACKCRNIGCVKLYCTCFQQGKLCQPMQCECIGCLNKRELDTIGGPRAQAIAVTLSRRPKAFEPRLKKKTGKGCSCKKNRCLKKYCDCRSIGVSCTTQCACSGCENRN